MTTTRPRAGDWMQTYTGRAFWPLDPEPADIDPVDIAHSLGMICRYGGHASRFYSVAEHCVLLSRAVAPQYALWALLHDATEAYVGDMIRPLKSQFVNYQEVEDNLMDVIAYRFGLEPGIPEAVHHADTRILLNEREALMSGSPRNWGVVEWYIPLQGIKITGWSPDAAKVLYLNRLAELWTES